jgi:hypothetical protein
MIAFPVRRSAGPAGACLIWTGGRRSGSRRPGWAHRVSPRAATVPTGWCQIPVIMEVLTRWHRRVGADGFEADDVDRHDQHASTEPVDGQRRPRPVPGGPHRRHVLYAARACATSR